MQPASSTAANPTRNKVDARIGIASAAPSQFSSSASPRYHHLVISVMVLERRPSPKLRGKSSPLDQSSMAAWLAQGRSNGRAGRRGAPAAERHGASPAIGTHKPWRPMLKVLRPCGYAGRSAVDDPSATLAGHRSIPRPFERGANSD